MTHALAFDTSSSVLYNRGIVIIFKELLWLNCVWQLMDLDVSGEF